MADCSKLEKQLANETDKSKKANLRMMLKLCKAQKNKKTDDKFEHRMSEIDSSATNKGFRYQPTDFSKNTHPNKK